MKYIVYLKGDLHSKIELESDKDDLTTAEIAFELGLHPDEIEYVVIE